MALSFCSNMATLQQLTPEMSTFQQRQGGLTTQFVGLHDNTFSYPLFEPDEFLYPDSYSSLPYFTPAPNPFISISHEFYPELYPTYSINHCDYPKRQKSLEDLYYTDFTPNCFDGYGLSSYPLQPDFMATEVPNPFVYSNGSVDSVKPSSCVSGSSSTQSVAARQRRRKIAEKTQDLAKLIPGGDKLNTAEMLQAAFKYVKYMQAQVGILQYDGPLQEDKDENNNVEGLGVLTSPRIQEKLYLEEKCLAPRRLIETLVQNEEIKLNSIISKGLDKLIAD